VVCIPRLATAYSRFPSISIWVAWIPRLAVGALDFKVWKCTREDGLEVPFCVDTLFNNVDQSLHNVEDDTVNLLKMTVITAVMIFM